MTEAQIEERVERIRQRLAEIDTKLATLEVVEDTDSEDPEDQAEILSKVTELRDERTVLVERLAQIAEEADTTL